jgi:hypothetical protein
MRKTRFESHLFSNRTDIFIKKALGMGVGIERLRAALALAEVH